MIWYDDKVNNFAKLQTRFSHIRSRLEMIGKDPSVIDDLEEISHKCFKDPVHSYEQGDMNLGISGDLIEKFHAERSKLMDEL